MRHHSRRLSALVFALFLPLFAVAPAVAATPHKQLARPKLQATATATARPVTGNNATTYIIIPDESQASYEVDEVFLDTSKLATAIGVTPLITGEISLDAANPANSKVGKITVNLTLLKSDEPNRDNKLPDYVIETRRWPVTTFEPTKLDGLQKTYKPGTPLTFKMTGDMTIRDAVHPVTFDVTATLTLSDTPSNNRLSGIATADIRLSDFGIDAPSLFAGFIRLEDEVKLKLNFVAKPKADALATNAVATKVVSCRPTAGRPLASQEVAPERSFVDKGHVLTGVIRSGKDCAPIARAKIVFLLANSKGVYDDDHRATVYTDARGAYRFESNFPGNYEGSPAPHIHLLISAPGHKAIETEYLPGKDQTNGTLDVTLAVEK